MYFPNADMSWIVFLRKDFKATVIRSPGELTKPITFDVCSFQSYNLLSYPK